jgi:hypothetical protein
MFWRTNDEEQVRYYRMKSLGQRSHFCAFFAVFFSMAIFSSCGIDLCYVGVEDSTIASGNGSELQVNYFFDRTESVGGFVQNDKETDYGRAIDSALTVGQTLGYEPSFYDFGERATSKLETDTVGMQKAIKQTVFYGNYTPSLARTDVKMNSGQPFSSVVDYIKTGTGTGSLNIVVTDLYEQEGINQYFHLLFQNAFQNGLSGAMFAVQSEFKGNIHSISSSNESLYGVDGYSTFFLLITGSKDNIEKYCDSLSEGLTSKGISFNKTLFLLGEDSYRGDRIQPGYRTVGNDQQFKAASEQFIMVNLNPAGQFIRKWRKRGDAFVPVAVKAESYLAVTNIDSQYVYKVPSGIEGDAKATVRNMSVKYFNGKKTAPGKVSAFEIASSGRVEEALTAKADGFNYITIKIHNKNLEKGYYRVQFDIIPDWVNELDANVVELKESNKRGELVKVLNLKLIYQNILTEFNKADGFSEVFYIVKD